MAITLVASEALAVATIMPVVSRHLGDLRLYGWVFSAFLLASLIGIAGSGPLTDRAGLVSPFAGGLILFAGGLVVGGLAPDMPVLLVGRVLQGVGAGVVPTTAYVAIARAYHPSAQPRMFAVLSTAWVVPGVAGPGAAALVATTVGWRWVFLGLLPLVALAGSLALAGLARVEGAAAAEPSTLTEPDGDGAGSKQAPRRGRSIRAVPVLGLVAGATVTVAGVSSRSFPALVVGGVAGVALILYSIRTMRPERSLAIRSGLAATVVSRGLLTFSFFAGDAFVPYCVTRRGGTTLLAGAALTASCLTWTAGSWVQERRLGPSGARRLVRGGNLVVVLGLAGMLAMLLPGAPPAVAVAAWAVAGLGIGLAYSPLTFSALQLSRGSHQGEASAALQLSDVLGQAIGTGLAGAVVYLGDRGPSATAGVATAFAMAAAVGGVALVTVNGRLPGPLQLGDPRPAPI